MTNKVETTAVELLGLYIGTSLTPMTMSIERIFTIVRAFDETITATNMLFEPEKVGQVVRSRIEIDFPFIVTAAQGLEDSIPANPALSGPERVEALKALATKRLGTRVIAI